MPPAPLSEEPTRFFPIFIPMLSSQGSSSGPAAAVTLLCTLLLNSPLLHLSPATPECTLHQGRAYLASTLLDAESLETTMGIG